MRPVLGYLPRESKLSSYGGSGQYVLVWVVPPEGRLGAPLDPLDPLDHPLWFTIPKHKCGGQSYLRERKSNPDKVNFVQWSPKGRFKTYLLTLSFEGAMLRKLMCGNMMIRKSSVCQVSV